MRRLLTVFCALASLTATSCGGGKLIKFADFHYRVSCREGAMTGHGCVSSIRDINNSDMTDNVRVSSCRVGRTGANPALSLSVSNKDMGTGQTFGVQISGAFFDEAMAQSATGAAVMGGGSCMVTVTEGGNLYAGGCGPATPSTAIPCQITGLKESLDNPTDMNPQIEGDLVCAHLKNLGDNADIREVEADSLTPSQAFHFRVVFCDAVMPPG